MLERHSLFNLIEISHHQDLRHAVHNVALYIDHLIEPPDYLDRTQLRALGINDEDDGMRVDDGETVSLGDDSQGSINMSCYKEAWADQIAFMTRKLHFVYLAQALYKLLRCRRVSIEDNIRPWGTFRLGRRIGTLPSRFVTDILPNSVVHAMVSIRTLFVAVIKSRLPIEELHIDFRTSMTGCTAAFPQILSLPRDLAQAAHNQLHTVQEFLGFIGLFPALCNLSPCFFPRDPGYQFPRISRELFVPTLQSISLELEDCTKSDLMALMERHKETLQIVRLECVSLPKGSPDCWSSVVQSFRDEPSIQKLFLGGYWIDGPRSIT
ncbi:hypothetical protein LZ31DRAFT_612138, partial [Colletotrichum somersetense]